MARSVILMHKDNPVAEVELYDNKPFKINKLYDRKFLPVGCGCTKDTDEEAISFAGGHLMAWNSRRAIPIGRINYKKLEDKYGDLNEYLISSLGLSLTDCYWYKPLNSDLMWDEVSLQKNGFISDLFLLNEFFEKTYNPDLTTNGVLEKYWINNDGMSCLVKAGELPGATPDGILAANEVVAAKVATLMKLEHANYYKGIYQNNKYCVSECVIKSDDYDMFSLEDYRIELGIKDAFFIRQTPLYSKFEKDFFNMAVFDVLLHNIDRHTSNISFLRDSSTGEYVKMAPLYDSGMCLNATMQEEHNLDCFKPFEDNGIDYLNAFDKAMFKNIVIPSKESIFSIIQETYKNFDLEEKYIKAAQRKISQNINALIDTYIKPIKTKIEIQEER